MKWLNNHNPNDLFVLELEFLDGKKSYLKGNAEKINDQYELFSDCPNVAELTIYNRNKTTLIKKVCLTNLI